MSSKTFDNTKINVEFDEDYQSRININSGENISSLFAKIRRFILDLKTVAFSGSYNDLSDVPDVVTKEYVDGEVNTNVAYGTCTTAAATAEKVVTITGNPNWKLQAGSIIVVKFSYTSTAQNPKLNVNGTGAKSIWYGSNVVTTSDLTTAGIANTYHQYLYDGTQFVWMGWCYDNAGYYSNALLGQVYSTCTTSEATTAKTVVQNDYVLSTGGIVAIKFTNAVPAGSTLNINSKGAKSIYYKGSAITDGVIKAGDTATFIYSGQYHLIAIDRDAATNAELTENIAAVKNDIAINRTTLGTQCKNLLKNNAVTKTVNGVTFTVNSDGSVTVNGTNTSSGTTYIQLCGFVDYGDGKLIASIGQNITDAYMAIYDSDWNWIGTGSAGTISWENSSKKRLVRLAVKSGATINNVTVYPMIRYADITDDTYESYKESVDERLIKNKSDIAVNKSTLGYQRKNILDETGYLSSITSVTRGTKSISGNQITLTATADNCFTNPHTSSDGGYRIPVEPDTDYILSWESDNTYAGLVYVFMNGNTSNYKNANNKVSKYIKFTTNSDTTFITIRLAVATSGISITYSNIMLRYADILDDTYEPYQPSVQEQINNFGTQQQLLCDYSSAATSSVTIQITGLFSNYSAVICIVKYSYGRTSFTLPLKYIKSIGTSKEYSPISELLFRYIDDNNLFIGGADAAISSVKIISLY